MNESVEVFRDLYLRGSIARRTDLRQALIEAAKYPWLYDAERSETIARNTSDADVLALVRKQSNGLPSAVLTLWSRADGYYVPNVVPTDIAELSVTQYNDILTDFITCIVSPVASAHNYTIETTEARQNVENWTSPDAARMLRIFSGAANKSTGASHPMDQRRWFDFIIAVHQSGQTISTDRLIRWLHEVDGWDEKSAHSLASDYEKALNLLQFYDEY